MKKWIELLEKGDKIITKENVEFLVEKVEGENIEIVGEDAAWTIHTQGIDWNKTGIHLIKRLWNEGKLNIVYTTHDGKVWDKVTKDEHGKCDIIKQNSILDEVLSFEIIKENHCWNLGFEQIKVDKTLEEYMKMKERHESSEITRKVNEALRIASLNLTLENMEKLKRKGYIKHFKPMPFDDWNNVSEKVVIGNIETNYDEIVKLLQIPIYDKIVKLLQIPIKETPSELDAFMYSKELLEDHAISSGLLACIDKEKMNKVNNKVIVKDMDFSALDGNEYVTSGGVKVCIGVDEKYLKLFATLNGKHFKEIKSFSLGTWKFVANNYKEDFLKEYGLELEFQESIKQLNNHKELWEFCKGKGITVVLTKDKVIFDDGGDFEFTKLGFEQEYNCKINFEL